MSYRFSQLSPQVSTNVRVIRGPWSPSPEGIPDAQFWRSWLEWDSEEWIESSRRLNWNAVFGLALTLGISCAFWTGVGLMAAYFWK